jgi:SAM-dependent methyltransferase
VSTRWQRIARRQGGEDYAAVYAERFRAKADSGDDVHGEADFVTGLTAAPARVLDAGCGTGRVAARLDELGYDVVGCDVDPTMIAMARRDWPQLDWRVADLADLQLDERFDVVLLAGNVVPLLEPGTLTRAASSLAAHVAADGRLVAGFGLDAAHLPDGCPPLPLADVDTAMADAGMRAGARWGTWDRQPFRDEGYVVAVYEHRAAVSEHHDRSSSVSR